MGFARYHKLAVWYHNGISLQAVALDIASDCDCLYRLPESHCDLARRLKYNGTQLHVYLGLSMSLKPTRGSLSMATTFAHSLVMR